MKQLEMQIGSIKRDHGDSNYYIKAVVDLENELKRENGLLRFNFYLNNFEIVIDYIKWSKEYDGFFAANFILREIANKVEVIDNFHNNQELSEANK